MKIYKEVGTKERLFEMMEKVNEVKLNESELINSTNVFLKAFNDLKNDTLNVNHTDVQSNGDKSFISLDCSDNNGNNIIFKFEAIAREGDQEGLFVIDTATIVEFDYKDKIGGNSIQIDANSLKQFNVEHTNEILEIVAEYANFESEEPELDEEYLKAIEKIDSYPFGGTPRTMQTSAAYADEKPVNPKLRVKSPQLEKYVDEETLPANDFSNVSSKYYEKSVSKEAKDSLIRAAKLFVDNELKKRNVTPDDLTPNEYRSMIKQMAIVDYENYLTKLNEESDYPNPMGDKFKIKFDYPKKKRKAIKTVTIDENDEENNNLGFGMNSNFQNTTGSNSQPIGNIEDLAKEKEEQGEIIKGGVGDEKSPLDFDKEEVLKGMKVEMEHTDDPMVAIELVVDHLTENPQYYTVSDNPEDSAQLNAATDAEEESGNNDDTADILLGFKPKNVGDYTNEINLQGIDTLAKLKRDNPPAWHQVQIAKKTLNMNDVGASIMG